MMGKDPKAEADRILGKMDGKSTPDAEPDDTDGDDEGTVAADALEGMYSAMKSGDFDAAAMALKAAMEACKDEY